MIIIIILQIYILPPPLSKNTPCEKDTNYWLPMLCKWRGGGKLKERKIGKNVSLTGLAQVILAVPPLWN